MEHRARRKSVVLFLVNHKSILIQIAPALHVLSRNMLQRQRAAPQILAQFKIGITEHQKILRQRPAFIGAADYRQWLSEGHALPVPGSKPTTD